VETGPEASSGKYSGQTTWKAVWAKKSDCHTLNRGSVHLLLTDGPPGLGRPVIGSIGGGSAVLIVAEPKVSGRHDMERR
jgi:MinD superfamily P-loop ATPase